MQKEKKHNQSKIFSAWVRGGGGSCATKSDDISSQRKRLPDQKTDGECGQRCGDSRTLRHCQGGCKMGRPLWKTFLQRPNTA